MNPISQLFNIKYPLNQAGMIWASGWELASAVSNSGALGVIGAGSMYPEILKEHIQKCKKVTNKPFGVNIPLFYPQIETHIDTIIKEKIKIVFTSGGSPKKWTQLLKDNGITVVHVVSSAKFAEKSQQAGVDAIVAEGFEAGGHNGREETTTLCLIPEVRKAVDIPLIAAGGIGSGKAMLAAMALGADGVQVGSRFVASEESSAHINFKKLLIQSKEGSTVLTLKELIPVRMIKNKFYDELTEAYHDCADKQALEKLLGRGRAKKGIFEGDLDSGELEIGQVSSHFEQIKPAQEIVNDIIKEYNLEREALINKVI